MGKIKYNKWMDFLIMLCAIALSGVISACSSIGGVTVTSTIPVNPTPRIVSTVTLQPIPANAITVDSKWQEVLHLAYSKNVAATGGDFFSSGRPYQISAICEGSGSITVKTAPEGSATFVCTQNQELQDDVVNNPIKAENLNVSVEMEGNVLWNVSVQILK